MQSKQKSRKSSLLWDLMKGNRLYYLTAIVCAMSASVFQLVSPLVLRTTIDSIIGDKPMDVPAFVLRIIERFGGKSVLAHNLWACGLVLVSVTLLQGFFSFNRGRWTATASEKIARNVRDSLYDKFHKLSYDYHVNAKTGDLIQRSTSDVETVRRFLSVQMVEVLNSVFLVSIVLVTIVSIDVSMAIISLILIPFIFAFAFMFFTKIRQIFRQVDESEGELSTMLQENLTGVRVVKAFGRQAFEYDKFNIKNTTFRDLSFKLTRLFAMYWSVSDFTCLLQIMIVTVSGVYKATTGQITMGTMIVFNSYIGMLLWPIRQMGRILSDMGKMTVSLERINEVLTEIEEEMPGGTKRPKIEGNIEFNNVTFGYDKNNPVLKDITFSVKKGQTVAILGPTGSGKTTLVHLLQRLYDYQEGSIKIDGVELKDIDKKWLRQNVGLVLQEPFLFSRTIKENIAISKADATEEEIFRAADIASMHDVISEFADGYDTLVGERGVTLSGGQKQRVAIARCIIRDCPILIFDDSLSAVDTETDIAIREALAERSKDITTFIISHRISTLAQADIILVLKDGRLIQKGTHEQLIAEEGMYKRIWSMQTSIEEVVELEHNVG